VGWFEIPRSRTAWKATHYGQSLWLGDKTVVPIDHVRVLGVFVSSDLNLDKNVTTISAACFYWLR